ncbi:oxalate decarboxylase [Vararia minispora EC-137]|uniref:Oxalate decarboxylase n=1 Tax=Vararia minispora EC-137 TaxID=1314806 RepID=A0ACB8QQ18_9AGAM|nr:oxalate decarboxylase [Vararia minispora EC-137]
MFRHARVLTVFALLACSAHAVPQVDTSSGSRTPIVSTASSANTASSVASSSKVASPSAPSLASTSFPETVSVSAQAPPETATVVPASSNPNEPIFPVGSTDETAPEAIRGGLGSPILGPTNPAIEQQNPDLLAPPTTDNGDIMNAKWPMALSHNRLQTGGWARQQNIEVMPIATQMAGVNMRLEKGAIRELHWHKTAEWAYVLKGTTQVTAVDSDGCNYLANVKEGDLWYFPPGIPHSLQATGDLDEGSEFLLVFDNGAFSEDATLLLTDWLAHVPMEVLSKSFQTDISAFAHIPGKQLYIFPGSIPTAAPSDNATAVADPQGQVPNPFSYSMSTLPATPLDGGSVKIVDSTTFKVSKTIAAAEVTVEPGAIRELHWHPTQDEWTFFISGSARVTLFGGQSNARTFDYQAGDVGYVPAAFGHYVENVGNETLRYLEIFKTDQYQDISLTQWLALTPPTLVKAHLGFDDATIAHLNKTKQVVVQN